MWALALVDRRDHFSLPATALVKSPLLGFTGSGKERALLFGSELAALVYPGFQNPINRDALTELLRFCYVPAPLSIYAGIVKLPAGHYVSIPLPLHPSAALPASRPGGRTTQIETSCNQPFHSEVEALEALDSPHRLLPTRPWPMFRWAPFSGGIDSSLVTTLLQNQSSRPVRTFTIALKKMG